MMNFEVGDTVEWNDDFGVVTRIRDINGLYSIVVDFGPVNLSFTVKGEYWGFTDRERLSYDFHNRSFLRLIKLHDEL
jgi:hypothetical protein